MSFKKKQIDDNPQKKEETPEDLKTEKKTGGDSDFNELKECHDSLAKVEKERADFLAGWQRERADFLNFKKEQLELFNEFKRFSKEDVILKVLPILDNIELALAHLPPNFKEDKWIEGILKIREQFEIILSGEGVEEIKSKGEMFNPEIHEAMETVASEEKEGVIMEVIQKGYLMNKKLIRPARVKVFMKKNDASSS